MSAVTTSDQLYVKPWQAREETTEGTFIDSSDGGSTLYTQIYGQLPPVISASIKVGHNYRDVAQVGPEDLLAIKRGKKFVEFSLTLQISDTYKSFPKYLWNAANAASPSGTPSKSLSMFMSKYRNNAGSLVEYYFKFTGCRIKTSTSTLKEDGDWEVACDFIALNLTITTSGLSTATPKTTFPSEETWDFDDGGVGHCTWNGTAVLLKELSVTIDRKTKVTHVTGNRIGYSSRTHGRRIAGTIKVVDDGESGMATDAEGDTYRTLAIVMKTGQTTMTLLNCKLKDLSEEASGDSEDETVRTYAFTAKSIQDVS